MPKEHEVMGQEPGVGAPAQVEATASQIESSAGDAGHPVGNVAITESSLTESPDSSPTETKPRYFRDHTNPYTMKMPDSWGSNRRT